MVKAMRQYKVQVLVPPLKDEVRILEKVEEEYNGDYTQLVDIARFTILCESKESLDAAMSVIHAADQERLVIAKDKDCFNHFSMTHHRFHNTRLYVKEHDVYIEIQATLARFSTLVVKGIFTPEIENPKLSHTLYEHLRSWPEPATDTGKKVHEAA